MVYDLIIVGASAAGVAASIYAARRKVNFLVLAKDIGGEVATSGEIENYPGFTHTDGIELTERFKQQLDYNRVRVQSATVTAVKQNRALFTVSTDETEGAKTYRAKAVIVAAGVHPRELQVPGEKEFRGRGVTYCTVCDGPLFKGKRVATIGGGNSALESALMLAEIASAVWVINKNDHFKGEQVLIEKIANLPNVTVIYSVLTTAIIGDQKVSAVEYRSVDGQRSSLPVDGVFIHIGMVPNSTFVTAEKSRFGEIRVDAHCQTSVPGLFAAGDVTDVPYKQIGIAVGQGIIAALSAIEYINRRKE